ncbi:hypothetical protein PanWU01x14_060080, partial [Parasponia andersonii]
LGLDFIGIVAISHGCTGVAVYACGLVAMDVINALSTVSGGTIELLYMQCVALHICFGCLVVCERSLNNTQNGPSMPVV